jgi:hypothetical protein
MRVYLYWFLAAVEDAVAIRSTATGGGRSCEEWTHLVVPGVDADDLNTLEKLARPKRRRGESRIGGVILDRSKMTATPFTAVSRVGDDFLRVLTSINEPESLRLAVAWSGAIEGVSEEQAVETVRRLAEFASRAVEAGLPVLQLDVL